MAILIPKTFASDLPAAYAAAVKEQEPLFVPAAVYADDRGWSVMNQLQGVLGPAGQVNYSLMYPGVVKAWHRHNLQTDFWMCVRGHIKIGVHRETDGRTWALVLGEQRAGILIIPPTLWHGVATVSHEPAGLFYYVTHAFNPQAPDEERRAFDSVPGFPWTVQNR